MKCPACGHQGSVFKCNTCGEVRCTSGKCAGTMNGKKGSGVSKVTRCKACGKGKYDKI